MSSYDREIQATLDDILTVSRRRQRTAVLFTAIPAFFAIVLIVASLLVVGDAGRKLTVIRGEVSTLTQSNADLAQQKTTLESDLANLTRMNGDLQKSNQDLLVQNQDLTVKMNGLQGQLKDAQTQLDAKLGELKIAQEKVDALQSQVTDLEKLLRESVNLQKYTYTGELFTAMKQIYNRALDLGREPVGNIFEQAMRLRDVPFKIDGNSPNEGFNSPAFAAYILQQVDLLPVRAETISNAQQLLDLFPKRGGDIRDGDLLIYPSGYCMFYYYDYAGRPFVIGMTPLGVLALNPDFATPLAVLAVLP